MTERYNVYSFIGIAGYAYGQYRSKKMSLSTYLKDKSHYDCPDTKRLFSDSMAHFDCEYMSMETLQKKVENGLSVFPINVSTDIDVVKSYLGLGLEVVFMRDRDFKQFKKDYLLKA